MLYNLTFTRTLDASLVVGKVYAGGGWGVE